MSGEFVPATTGLSRVFVQEGRAGPAVEPEYFSCYRAQALSQSFGDVTDIECPHPTRPGVYEKIGSFQTAEERATITLEGRYAIDLRSRLLQMARKKCSVDVQVHFGDCEDLSDHNSFKKVLYLHDALLSSYNTDDLGSLSSSDTAAVNENVELSAREIFDIIPQTWAAKADNLVTTEALDVAICDEVSCGECGTPSDGCQRIFVITKVAVGSPGTPPDVVYSVDGGITWFSNDIDGLGSNSPDEVDCLKGYLVIPSYAAAGIAVAPISQFDAFGTDPAFTLVTAGISAGPTCIKSLNTVAWLGGRSGHIYKMENPLDGVVEVEGGALTPSHLNAIDALNENLIVAVGEDGIILVSKDGESFTVVTTGPVGVGIDYLCVAIKSKNEWWVGTDAGRLYYTLDAGLHWAQKAFPGSGLGAVRSIDIQNDSIMHLGVRYTAPDAGRVLTSFNGGYDFEIMPLGSALMPASTHINAVMGCRADPGLVVAVGLRTGVDGIILTGKM